MSTVGHRHRRDGATWWPAAGTGRPGPTARSCGWARTGPASAALDAWLDRQPDPVTLVVMESSGHYWMPLASHLRRHERPGGPRQPARGEVLCEEPPGPHQVRPGGCPEPRRDGHARRARRPRPARRGGAAPGGPLRDDPGRGAGEGLPAPPPARRARLPGARRGVRGPDLPDRPGGAAPRADARRPPAPADEHPRRRERRSRAPAPRPGEGRAPARPGGRLDRGPRARGRGGLRGRPAARPVRPAGAPDRGGRRARRLAARRRARPPAPDHPGRRSRDLRRAHRRDRRHQPVRDVRPAARLRRRPSRPSAAPGARARTPRPPGT